MKQQEKNTVTKTKIASQTVALRGLFYYDFNKRLKYCVISSSITLLLLLFSAFFINSLKSKNKYITLNNDEQIVFLKSLNEKNQEIPAITDFVANAIIETFTFSFKDMDLRLNNTTKKYYTDAGAASIIQALKKSQNLDLINDSRLFQTIELKHTPFLDAEGNKEKGEIFWRFIIEGTIKLASSQRDYPNNEIRLIVDVVRTSQKINFEGIGINKVILEKK